MRPVPRIRNLAVATLFSATSGVAAQQPTLPRFETSDCAFERPANVQVDCGYFVVPEVRSRPDGRVVRLAVATSRPPNPTSAPPMVFLHGGPGGSWLADSIAPPQLRGALAQARELILYDQRGSGLSEPLLCPEYNDSIVANRHSITRANGAVIREPLIRQCIVSLRAQGIDPEAYNTAVHAADLVDLRRAIGYERWDIRGVSYGARLALAAMLVDSAAIRTVTLLDPPPPGAWTVIEAPLNYQRTLGKLFAICAATESCSNAFPTPSEDFVAVYTELRQQPLQVPLLSGMDTVLFDGERFRDAIGRMLAVTAQLPRVPFIVNELRRGDRLRAAQTLVQAGGRPANVLAVLNLVHCYDIYPLPAQQRDSLNALLGEPFRANDVEGLEDCVRWRSTFATEEERAPVHSEIPTLILVGDLDVRTPPEHARRIAQSLTHSYVYVLPGLSHEGQSMCNAELVAQFLADPTRAPDASSCISQIPKLSFITRWPEP
jgi:pimeloyl-ACP methyl ester carboxylesterase